MIDLDRQVGPGSDWRERYRANGYAAPIDALSAEETAASAEKLRQLFALEQGRADPALRHKPYLRLRWVSDLLRHPRVLDTVEELLGPNLLAFRGTFFIKPAGDPALVPWHQDRLQNQLDPEGFVSAWIALTDSGPHNGCVRVVPGSHHRGDVPHTLNTARNRTLQLGQTVVEPIADEDAVNLELRAGQFSLHHGRLIHGSSGNPSDAARVGLAVRYARPDAARSSGKLAATVVRGEDREGGFEHEPVPRFDDDPVCLEWHARSMRGYAKSLILETVRHPTRERVAAVARMIFKPSNLRLAADLVRRRRRS